MSGGGFLQNYMRIFGQEGIGRPDLEADSEINSIRKALIKGGLDENEIPEINAMLVFTADDVEIEADEAPIPTLQLKKIKDFIRNKSKEKPISSQTLEKVKSVLPEE